MSKKEKKVKEKKPKKVKIPFDKIDITTATEDEIIESGKWHNTKADFTCYFIMLIIFVLMILPPVLRKVIPKPITEVTKTVTYGHLTCYKSRNISGYDLVAKLEGTYRDSEASKIEIEYTYKKVRDDASDNFTYAEIEELKVLDLKGMTKKNESDKAIFTMDFYNYQDLMMNETLEKYANIFGVATNTFRSMDYYCSSTVEEVEELVYVDTGRKVED